MTELGAALAVGAGLAFVIVGVAWRARERLAALAAILELPGGERDVDPADVGDHLGLLDPGVKLVDATLARLRLADRLRRDLERAQVPLRPGELTLALAAAGGFGMLLVWFLTQQIALGLPALVVVPWLGKHLAIDVRIDRRRKAAEEQLPEALSLIAGSLEAGHTFLRAIEMLLEEIEPPLSVEFERVIAETRLGDPLVEALQRMADRLEVEDLRWVVQAIRIQQTVGGALAELLATLAEFMRQRQEIRREVGVLTAEGRLSAFVLGGLPFGMLLVLQTFSPGYLAPMFSGWGLAALIGAFCSVVTGIAIIMRMARIDV